MKNRKEILGLKFRPQNFSRKGVGTAVGTILIIAIFTAFFAVYLYMANNNIESRTKLNFESLSLMKLKSTFLLFNQSLGTTWLISTVQAVFITGDESVGCGKDDSRLSEGYWYQRRPDAARDGQTDSRGNPRIPAADKYNIPGFNPQICYPRDQHVKEYILKILDERDFLRLRQLRPEEAGGITIIIQRDVNDNEKVGATINMNLKDDRIESTFSQKITASYGNGVGVIDRQTANDNTIFTSLKQMAAAGRSVVESLSVFGDGRTGGPGPPPDPIGYGVQNQPSNTAYQSVYKDLIESTIRAASSPIPGGNIAIVTTTGLEANTGQTAGVIQLPRSGLVFHFVSMVTYSEPARYYYHNVAENKFEKKPIELTYKVEDYLSALSCVEYQEPAFPSGIALMNWQSPDDMMCCAGFLFSCGSIINSLPTTNQIATGGSMVNSGSGDDQSTCLNTLGGRGVQCTAAGFMIS